MNPKEGLCIVCLGRRLYQTDVICGDQYQYQEEKSLLSNTSSNGSFKIVSLGRDNQTMAEGNTKRIKKSKGNPSAYSKLIELM